MSTSLFGTLAAQSHDDDDLYIQVLYVPLTAWLASAAFHQEGVGVSLGILLGGIFCERTSIAR